MNATRTAVVSQAFDKLDRTGDGKVTVEDLRGVYSAANHPDVRSARQCDHDVALLCAAQVCGVGTR